MEDIAQQERHFLDRSFIDRHQRLKMIGTLPGPSRSLPISRPEADPSRFTASRRRRNGKASLRLRRDLDARAALPINRLFTVKPEKSGRGQKPRPPLFPVERVQNRAIHVSSEVVLRPMKSGGPWNLRGLRPQTVEAAHEAARQSGRSLGEWLNDLIQDHDDYRRAAMQPADYGDMGDYGGE